MRTKFSKIALAATFGLALTFTLSCSSGGGDDLDDNGGGGGGGGNGGGPKELIATEVRTNIEYGSNGEIHTYERKTEYKYDSKGNRIKSISYDSDGDTSRTDKYDNKGNVIERIYYDFDGSMKYKNEQKYDNKGNVIEYINYDSDGDIINKDEVKYDSKGNMEIISYNYSDESIYSHRREYEYDSNGNITKRTDYYLQDGKYVKGYEDTYVYTYIRL
jgi:hypothetical protein